MTIYRLRDKIGGIIPGVKIKRGESITDPCYIYCTHGLWTFSVMESILCYFDVDYQYLEHTPDFIEKEEVLKVDVFKVPYEFRTDNF